MNRNQELRQTYYEIWLRRWPHDNKILDVLWLEAKAELGIPPKSKHGGARIKQLTLEKMRYDHEF